MNRLSLIGGAVAKFRPNETFTDSPVNKVTDGSDPPIVMHMENRCVYPYTTDTTFDIFSFIISFIGGIVAVYLSWSSNTLYDTHVSLKILFAFIAFLFGWIYVIGFFIFAYHPSVKQSECTGKPVFLSYGSKNTYSNRG
jgi:hypothetical protein